jgi:Spy/CpxP family protein refolding chaperone
MGNTPCHSDSAIFTSCPDRIASCSDARQDGPAVLRPITLVAVCLCAAASAEAQSTPYKWWLSHDVRTQLHLTSEQVRKINAIFESNLPERRALREELDGLQHQLDALLDSATAEDSDAAALITRVETTRARRNTARMLMLYRMRQVLTAEQRRWFQKHAVALYGQ